MKKILICLSFIWVAVTSTGCGKTDAQKEKQADEGVKKAYSGLSNKRLK